MKEENGYSVIFPDLNHLATCGETLDEALVMAVDCLYWLQQNNETAPSSSAMDIIHLSDVIKELEVEPREAFVNMVTVDVAEYAKAHLEKSVKKTLTIPAWLNTAALEQNVNFSQVLQDALKAQLHVG